MWLILSLLSALLLGLYDVAKKKALSRNGALWVLLAATALTTLFLSPFLRTGPWEDHLQLLLKSLIVTISWVSGMMGLKLLPITAVSTIKGSRPLFVVLFSILLFGERLSGLQAAGMALVLLSLLLLTHSTRKEQDTPGTVRGFVWMGASVLAGVASALYDKHIMSRMDPLFVQAWVNLYISLQLIVLIALKRWRDAASLQAFRWDWTLLLIAILITGADCAYFYALKEEGAMLSVVSVLRRCSVLVSFVCGAWLFKERNLKQKSLNLILMIAGVALLLIAG